MKKGRNSEFIPSLKDCVFGDVPPNPFNLKECVIYAGNAMHKENVNNKGNANKKRKVKKIKVRKKEYINDNTPINPFNLKECVMYYAKKN